MLTQRLTDKLVHINRAVTVHVAKVEDGLDLVRRELVRGEHLPLGEGPIPVDVHPHEGRLDILHRPHVPLPELRGLRGLDLEGE